MSVEPGNRLWNRLLARAEARAAKGTPPEPHHYRPVSASDDHLRSSFENSLIYHGLKIETEFNLRLQPPPRKRKTKRKSDLPIAERLRNDRAAAGSPGPTHRTPTGTPARRISKSTPLSRPPIPIPPPLPPIPVTTGATAAKVRVLNAVSDDYGPPAPRNPPVVELIDSSDDALVPARSAKRDSGSGLVSSHFDLAPDSNYTSLWEEDAILIGNPSKEDECPDDWKLDAEVVPKSLGKKESAQHLRAPYKTSKQDRVRRARARKNADSDSSLAGDSGSGKSKHTKESRHQGTPIGDSSKELLKNGRSSDRQGTAARERNPETYRAKPSISINDESSSRQNMPKQGSAFDNHAISDTLCSKRSLLSEDLLARISTLKRKDSTVISGVNGFVDLSWSSDEEHLGTYRSSPPMRPLSLRRRTPPNVSIEDKLFGKLSPLNSPRRRTRSMSGSKKRSSRADAVSSPMEESKIPASRRKDIQDNCETSEATGGKAQRPMSTPTRRVSRRSVRDANSRKRGREEEVISTSPVNLKATTSRKSSSPIDGARQQKKAKPSIEEGSLGDLSDEIFDVDLMVVDANKIQNLPKNIKRNKTPPSSSLSESTIDAEESNSKRRVSAIRRKSRNQDVPLSVNAAFRGQHRVPSKALETTGNPVDVLEILDGDSDACRDSVSPVVKRRRVTRNKRGCKRIDILGQEKESPKEPSKESSTKSASRGSVPSPEATKQENQGDKRSAVSRALPLRLPGSAIAQEHLNPSRKVSSTKSTSPSSDSSSETIKQSTQREAPSGVNRRISSRARRYAAAQEHRKASSGPTKQKRTERSPENRRSPAIDLQMDSKQDIQGNSKPSVPVRIRRRTTTAEDGTASSKSPRGRSSDDSEDIFRPPSKNTQKQAKRDVGPGSSPGPPSRSRRRTITQKQKRSSSNNPRGSAWDSLSERLKQRIQKAFNEEIDY